jgi:hypothetical protein
MSLDKEMDKEIDGLLKSGSNQSNSDWVEDAVTQLRKKFDCVQIFVSKQCKTIGKEDSTFTYSKGTGNWFARYGQVSLWLQFEQEKEIENNMAILEVQKEMMNRDNKPKPDFGDNCND